MSSATEADHYFRAENLRSRSVPPVSVAEMGMAFTLFRRAALDEEVFADDPFEPLSDRYAEASLTEEGFRRGMAILKIHCNHPDTPNAVMRRVEAFVQLLRSTLSAPDADWIRFCEVYDRFTPIVHALAWCPLVLKESFNVALFLQIAGGAPLTVDVVEGHRRCN